MVVKCVGSVHAAKQLITKYEIDSQSRFCIARESKGFSKIGK